MTPENMFVMSLKSGEYIKTPDIYKPSACTPLFMAAYTERNAGSCIHTHSQVQFFILTKPRSHTNLIGCRNGLTAL